MPESTDPESPLFWSAFVRTRLGSTAIDADVIEEIADHAEEAYRVLHAGAPGGGGRSAGGSARRVAGSGRVAGKRTVRPATIGT
jgi:hypothetical protein